jgi:hypothetical protein
MRVPPPAPHTLKAAILNVTADFNEVSTIVIDICVHAMHHLLQCVALVAIVVPWVLSGALQLAHLIQEFLRSPAVESTAEESFRHFLSQRANRSHPVLENALDWVLALYKFAFPFMVISLIAKLSASGGPSRSDNDESGLVSEGRGLDIQPLPERHNSKGRVEKLMSHRPNTPLGPETPVERAIGVHQHF